MGWRFAWPEETPTRRGRIRGTLRIVTFTDGGGRAREALPMDITEAIRFFDPFQARPAK